MGRARSGPNSRGAGAGDRGRRQSCAATFPPAAPVPQLAQPARRDVALVDHGGRPASVGETAEAAGDIRGHQPHHQPGMTLDEAPGGLDASDPGHPDVHQDEIRTGRIDDAERLLPRARLADDPEPRRRGDDLARDAAKRLVVVDHREPYDTFPRRPGEVLGSTACARGAQARRPCLVTELSRSRCIERTRITRFEPRSAPAPVDSNAGRPDDGARRVYRGGLASGMAAASCVP